MAALGEDRRVLRRHLFDDHDLDAGGNRRIHGARHIGDAVGEGWMLDGEIAAVIVVLDIDDDEGAARLGGWH